MCPRLPLPPHAQHSPPPISPCCCERSLRAGGRAPAEDAGMEATACIARSLSFTQSNRIFCSFRPAPWCCGRLLQAGGKTPKAIQTAFVSPFSSSFDPVPLISSISPHTQPCPTPTLYCDIGRVKLEARHQNEVEEMEATDCTAKSLSFTQHPAPFILPPLLL